MTDGIWIQGTQDPATGRPFCVMTWDTLQAELSIDAVCATARDLTAAAAHAETDAALVEELTSHEGLGLDLQTAGTLLTRVRERRTPPTGPGRPALRIHAVYGAHTRLPLVHIARGSHKGELTPDEARQMAQHWTETAISALLDARTRYVLGDFGFDHVRTDDFFAAMQNLHLKHEGYTS